ncbi:MAG: c-type cytochrome [Porphyromonadaceae bacterium]|nr:c-type cytochrome [Porphyromonadaceae bacterium]
MVIIIVLSIIGGGLSVFLNEFIDFSSKKSIETTAPKTKLTVTVSYNPPLPQDAPENIRDAVMLGYNIMMNTQKYAAGYIGTKLNCTNCHFNGGITDGGRNGGLSLVGVATKYPEYRKQEQGVSDLFSRTNSCFEKSMNGKPLPSDSKEMIALVTYYQWISNGLPIYEDIPWLGIKLIKRAHTPEPGNGKQIFMRQCAACHGDDGQGRMEVPPLWGSGSFNDGAGMNKVDNLAAFAFQNMPRTNPYLTAEQALDVAVFVSAQPRPHFTSKKK